MAGLGIPYDAQKCNLGLFVFVIFVSITKRTHMRPKFGTCCPD